MTAHNLRSMPVQEIMKRFPETAPVLAKHRIDLCCGGRHTLAEVAGVKRFDLQVVEEELESAIHGTHAE